MKTNQNTQIRIGFEHLAVGCLLLLAEVGAQQLASYDHNAIGEELAAASCAPLPLVHSEASLIHPPASCGWSWWFGGVAADNMNARLYYANGHPCDGIQRVNFADIGTATPPVTYLTPPGLNQVSRLVVDPRFPAGNVLWVTSGYEIVQYDVLTGAFLAGPIPTPSPASVLTGLAWNVSTGRIHAVDANAVIWRFNPATPMFFGGPTPPAYPVPPQATGIEFCGAGSAWVSFYNSTVLQPLTGVVRPFPPASAAPRRHHGLTFMGSPFSLGGGSIGGPVLTARGLPGNLSTSSVLNFTGHDVGPILFVAVDPTNFATSAATGAGVILINSMASIILGPMVMAPCPSQPLNGCVSLSLSTYGLPPGLAVQVQGVELGSSGPLLSNALQIMVFQQ